jgi:hypothetical protein
MKTKSSAANGYSQIFSRRAPLVATILAVSALLLVRPAFAQEPKGTDSEDPAPWGSTIVANPPDPLETAAPPSIDQPWAYTAHANERTVQSPDTSALATPPIQPVPESPLASVPPAPDGYRSDSENPPPWGATVVPSPNNYGDVSPYMFNNAGAYTPSYGGSAMAPVPQQSVQPEAPQGYVPPAPVGLVESFGHGPINPTFPELPPSVLGRPVGTYQNPIR